MYFRIQTDQIDHSRQVYRFMDWLGDVGGIGEILTILFMFVFGGYLKFHLVVTSMQSLYSPEICHTAEVVVEGGEEEIDNSDIFSVSENKDNEEEELK